MGPLLILALVVLVFAAIVFFALQGAGRRPEHKPSQQVFLRESGKTPSGTLDEARHSAQDLQRVLAEAATPPLRTRIETPSGRDTQLDRAIQRIDEARRRLDAISSTPSPAIDRAMRQVEAAQRRIDDLQHRMQIPAVMRMPEPPVFWSTTFRATSSFEDVCQSQLQSTAETKKPEPLHPSTWHDHLMKDDDFD